MKRIFSGLILAVIFLSSCKREIIKAANYPEFIGSWKPLDVSDGNFIVLEIEDGHH